jgi:cysteine desulfurase family protein (TIGR01976 family)
MNKTLRDNFPSLSRKIANNTCVFLDGPAGTQVPNKVIDGISDYYKNSNANTHGVFTTTIETDAVISRARKYASTFLGAEGSHNISFGQNMTTLNFSLARAIGRYLQVGDEILITQLDHEANRGPWLSLRAEGIIVREVRLLASGVLDYEDFEAKINERTRLVCMGWSSNITGTINDVERVRALSYKVGALLLIDAVHYAPHYRMDVQALGCDFLLCSAYKFYGPHVGILYARTGLLDRLPTDRLRTADQHAPYSIETGTLNHAAIAGVTAAIQFIADMGKGQSLNDQLDTALSIIHHHEHSLAIKLYDGLCKMPELNIIGPNFEVAKRAPTISFIHHRLPAIEVCKYFATQNIFAWDGHFYAMRAAEVLGLLERGGVTRMGISAYTNEEDIDRTLSAIKKLG